MATRFSNFKRGIQKLGSNPQLIYTIVVAGLIAASFIFISERFTDIARDAQERLINVRIGSLQDAFVPFAGDRYEDKVYLGQRIRDIQEKNETIETFHVIEKQISPETGTAYVIVASSDPTKIGTEDPQADFLYNLAVSDPENSLTIESSRGDERLFRTARAISGPDGKILGIAMTTQTLSQADKVIEDNITESIFILIVVLIVLMLLFLRHSKIIDYTVLYKKLKEVDELKDDFISMASHELRTPLSTIRGYAEFIREAPELTLATKEFATRIDVSAKDLDSLVADILDVSRIEQGRMSFNTTRLDPTSLIEDVVSSLVLPAKDKGLSLAFQKNETTENRTITVDKDRLKQVLVNIIGNAVKYTKNGEVKVKEYVEDSKLFIRISDTGIGMSEEERKKLFEKFYRIRTKETEDIRGTGLGLWITSQIVKEMGGAISVESIKGVGSHFILSFPIIK